MMIFEITIKFFTTSLKQISWESDQGYSLMKDGIPIALLRQKTNDDNRVFSSSIIIESKSANAEETPTLADLHSLFFPVR